MRNTRNINKDYVKSYSASYTNNILDTAFKDGPFLLGDDLKKLCSPDQINFNLLKAVFLQWEAEVDKLQNPYFDHDAPAVQNALKTYMDVLSRHIKLNKGSLRPLLQQAVEETIYQVFTPSFYFQNLLWPYEMGDLRLEDLDKLKRFVRINRPFLKELVEICSKEKKEIIPISEFQSHLRNLCQAWDIQWESNEEHANDFSKVVALHSKSLWESEPTAESEEEDSQGSINQAFAKKVVSLNETLQKDQVTLADELNKQVDKEQSLSKSLNINQKFRFVNELYNGNSTEFEDFLARVERCQNHQEALGLLQRESGKKLEWNPNDEVVKELMTVISKRFSVPGPAFDEHPSSTE